VKLRNILGIHWELEGNIVQTHWEAGKNGKEKKKIPPPKHKRKKRKAP
jgi:hypothetical protein